MVSLGRGQRVPYPEPGSPAASKIGRANRRVDSKPEIELRRHLHALGLRYRKDPLVRAGSTRTHPDVVFGAVRLAIFVDGCFWHVCPDHFHHPKTNLAYWEPKLKANQERDRKVGTALSDDGWTVLRIWEHTPVDEAVRLVVDVLATLGHAPALRLQEMHEGMAEHG